MKLHQQPYTSNNQITGYAMGKIAINGNVYSDNIIITATQIVKWPASSFARLSEADFVMLLEFQPSLVLLGTGLIARFPHPQLIQSLIQKQIGVESMEIGSACRTFNVLIADQRQALLAVLHD